MAHNKQENGTESGSKPTHVSREFGNARKISEDTAELQSIIDAQEYARQAAEIGETAASLTVSKLAVNDLPSFPLTHEGAEILNRYYPQELVTQNHRQSELLVSIGGVLDELETLKNNDPNILEPTAYRELYSRLAEYEKSLPLLDLYNRVNAGRIAKMPLPRLELARLDRIDRVQRILENFTATQSDVFTDAVLVSKSREILRGFATGLINDVDDIEAMITFIIEKPDEFKRAFELSVRNIGDNWRELVRSGYDSAIDSTESFMQRTVHTEGDSLAFDVGYVMSKTFIFLVPGAGIEKGIAVGANSVRELSKLPQNGDSQRRFESPEMYEKLIQFFQKKAPNASVLSIRALVEEVISQYGTLSKTQQSTYLNDLLASHLNVENKSLLDNKPLLKFVIDCAYTLSESYRIDVMNNVVGLKTLIKILEARHFPGVSLNTDGGVQFTSLVLGPDGLPQKEDAYKIFGIS